MLDPSGSFPNSNFNIQLQNRKSSTKKNTLILTSGFFGTYSIILCEEQARIQVIHQKDTKDPIVYVVNV